MFLQLPRPTSPSPLGFKTDASISLEMANRICDG